MPDIIPAIEYGTVVGFYEELTGDTTDDSDDKPDGYYISAVVRFVPDDDARVIKAPGASPPKTIYQQDVIATLTSGQLTQNGQPYVRLVASVSGTINPQNWFWTAKFEDAQASDGTPITLPDVRFQLPAGEPGSDTEVDLTNVSTTIISGNTVTVQGPPGSPGVPLRPQGHVANQAALPSNLTSSVTDLDKAYTTDDTGTLFVWNGASWINMGVIRGPSGGATGAPGATPTIVVGAVETLAPTASAYVQKDPSSTATNVILNFGIPQGVQGLKGDQGDPGVGGGGGTGGVTEHELLSLRRQDSTTGLYNDGDAPDQTDTTLYFVGSTPPSSSSPILKDGALFSATDSST